jgi:DNA-binding NarL/FixJ family response regulator
MQTPNAQSDAPIRVAIIEDERRTREALRTLIESSAGFQCAGCWSSVEEALPAIGHAAPQVTLLDLVLPGMTGIAGIGPLRERHPDSAFVVLTVYEDNDRVFDALCAGADGYLLKNTPTAKLLDALREAVAGGAPMSGEIARRVIEVFHRFRPPKKAPHDLTPHELRLLGLLVKGYSYKSAAAELGVSINTIAFHVQNIYGKLRVHSKSQAVARALRDHLID